MQGEEEQLLSQWQSKHQLVDENLCVIEQKFDQFSEIPEDEALLEAAVEENEVCPMSIPLIVMTNLHIVKRNEL